MENKDGVWRTIRGRRVFIAKGESLGSAMSRSGKFKNLTRTKLREAKDELRLEDRTNKWLKGNNKTKDKQRKKMYGREEINVKNRGAEQDRKNKLLDERDTLKWGETRVERNINKYSDTDIRELRHEELQKKLADYKAKKQSNNKITQGEPLKELANERIKEKENTLANDKAMLEGMKRKGLKDVNGWTEKDFENRIKKNEDYLKQSNNKVESRVEKNFDNYGRADRKEAQREEVDRVKKYYQDEENRAYKNKDYSYGYTKEKLQSFSDKELENYVGKQHELYEKYKSEHAKSKTYDQRQTRNRQDTVWNSGMETKYKTQYENALKEVARREETIKNYVEKKKSNNATKKDKNDWLPKETKIEKQGTSNRKEVSDNIQAHILSYYDSPEDFIKQMDVMKQPTNWHNGQKIAEGGSYLIYNGDMADFLDKLKINPKGKKISEDKAFNTYVSLIGRESAKLYDKIKKHQKDK